MVSLKTKSGEKNSLDLVALTYVKCDKSYTRRFQVEFIEEYIESKHFYSYAAEEGWILDCEEAKEGIVPLFIITTVGHFDFIIGFLSSSTYLVTQFSMEVLRSEEPNGLKKGFGVMIKDTNTVVGVDAHWLIDNVDIQ